jgi:hypothetical protein
MWFATTESISLNYATTVKYRSERSLHFTDEEIASVPCQKPPS